MEKILDKEFRAALMATLVESGMSNEESMKFVDSKYKIALKRAAISRLEEVISLIKEDKYDEVSKLIEDSPAGDGYGTEVFGCDNSYISFKDVTDYEDIGNIIEELKSELCSFKAHPYKEITANDILSIKTEEEYPLKPFDRVLVRDSDDNDWCADLFSHYDVNVSDYPFRTLSACYKYCIPYEGNEHLIGTNDDLE